MTPLHEKYKPRTLDDIIGQPWLVSQLRLYLEDPHPCAFLFSGDTGTGKSSAALALAADLGILVDRGEFSGLWQIASGEQTAESVGGIMEKLRVTPWEGSGWRLLVVNECDAMSGQAQYKWLDILEFLPPRCVICFTTNKFSKLSQRFRDRCEVFHFESGVFALAPSLQPLVDRVWKAETGRDDAPAVMDLVGLVDEDGNVSVRRLLQLLTPLVRDAQAGRERPSVKPPQPKNSSEPDSIYESSAAVGEVVSASTVGQSHAVYWLIGGALLVAMGALALAATVLGQEGDELKAVDGRRYKPHDLLR